MRNITVTVNDVYTYEKVEVDLDDVLSELSSYETQQLVDELYDDGYYQTELEKELMLGTEVDSTVSINEQFFRTELFKIRDNYLNLSHSEIEIIEAIAKRF
jgi:hypothetical protein